MKKIIAVLLMGVALLTGCSEKVEFGSQSNNAGTYAVDLGDIDEVYIEVKEDVEAKEEIAEEPEVVEVKEEIAEESEVVEVKEEIAEEAEVVEAKEEIAEESEVVEVKEEIAEESEAVEVKEEIAEEAEEEEIYIQSDNNSEIVEVTEKMFVAQMNDIYINADDYIGKTIAYEGMMGSYYWEETDLTYYYVMRYGPGCCANDGEVGLEIMYDGDYPEDNEWVRVVGILEYYREDGYDYLILNLSSIAVLDERGAETVLQ